MNPNSEISGVFIDISQSGLIKEILTIMLEMLRGFLALHWETD